MNDIVKEWMSEISSATSRTTYLIRLKNFLKWYQKPITDLLKLSPKKFRHLLLKFQTDMVTQKMPNNSILGIITAMRSLYKYETNVSVDFRNKLVKLEEAQNKHSFSNGDLKAMFDVASLRGKALIAIGSSLGWGISDVVKLKRQFIKALVDRAREHNERFAYFKRQRGKTRAKAYGVLNPCAIEWLQKWFETWNGNSLFDITADQINKELKRIAKESGITTTGNVSWHCFRSWVFDSLIKSGLSEMASKYIVGKSVPLSDSTYLNLAKDIEEKYPKIYDKHMCITRSGIEIKSKDEQIEKLERALVETESKIGIQDTRITAMQKELNELREWQKQEPARNKAIIKTFLELDKQARQRS